MAQNQINVTKSTEIVSKMYRMFMYNNTQETIDREYEFPAGSIRFEISIYNKCWIRERSIRLYQL